MSEPAFEDVDPAGRVFEKRAEVWLVFSMAHTLDALDRTGASLVVHSVKKVWCGVPVLRNSVLDRGTDNAVRRQSWPILAPGNRGNSAASRTLQLQVLEH